MIEIGAINKKNSSFQSHMKDKPGFAEATPGKLLNNNDNDRFIIIASKIGDLLTLKLYTVVCGIMR